MNREALKKACEAGLIKMAQKRNGSHSYIANAKVEDLRGQYTILYGKYKGKNYHAVFLDDLGYASLIGIPMTPTSLSGLSAMIVRRLDTKSSSRLGGPGFWRSETDGRTVQQIIDQFEPDPLKRFSEGQKSFRPLVKRTAELQAKTPPKKQKTSGGPLNPIVIDEPQETYQDVFASHILANRMGVKYINQFDFSANPANIVISYDPNQPVRVGQ